MEGIGGGLHPAVDGQGLREGKERNVDSDGSLKSAVFVHLVEDVGFHLYVTLNMDEM